MTSEDGKLKAELQREERIIVSCVVLASAAGSMAFPILPIYSLKAGVSLALIGVVLAANRIGRIATTPVVGVMVDRVGARRTLLTGQGLQALAMLLYVLGIATSHPVAFFFWGRLVHGVASACIYVSAQTLAIRAGSGRVGGMVRAAMAAGVPLGLVLGGGLSDRFGAMTVFAGAAVVTSFAWLATTSMTVGEKRQAHHPATYRQLRSLLANKRLASVAVMSFAGSFAAHGVVMTTLSLLIEARHVSLYGFGSQGTSGVMMGWMVVLIAIGSPLAGALGDWSQRHDAIALSGLLLCVPAMAIIGLSSTAACMGMGVALIGLAAAALGPSLLSLVHAVVPADYQGQSIGLVQLSGDVGGLLGPIVGTLLAGTNPGTPYVVSAGLALAALPSAIYLVRHRSSLRTVAVKGI